MLNFIRSDLAQLIAYTPHPGGTSGEPSKAETLDRLDTNETPYDLPEELKQKLAIAYEREIEANRYPDGGHGALKEAIAAYVRESAAGATGENPDSGQQAEQLAIAPANISIGNGSDELIRSLLIATCLGGQGSILVANPTFSMYGILAKTLAIPVVEVGRKEANFEIDLEAAQEAIASSQNPPVRVVFLVHPNSPTAQGLTDAELDWLRSLPEDILAVIDEAYFEFSQTTLVGELHQHPNWLILRTFSKAFRLAAHRVGYAIGNEEAIATLEKVRLPYNLPSFSQAAALTALHYRQLLFASVPEIIAERQRLSDALSQIPSLRVWPSIANFLYLRPTTDISPGELTQKLKAKGTMVRHTGGGIRITIGSPEENSRTLERLQKI